MAALSQQFADPVVTPVRRSTTSRLGHAAQANVMTAKPQKGTNQGTLLKMNAWFVAEAPPRNPLQPPYTSKPRSAYLERGFFVRVGRSFRSLWLGVRQRSSRSAKARILLRV